MECSFTTLLSFKRVIIIEQPLELLFVLFKEDRPLTLS